MRTLFLFLACGVVLAAPLLFAQSAASDSQTLQALLTEVRLLRRDLRTTSVIGERVQIALYRLQVQQGVAARATQIANDARAKLDAVRTNKQKLNDRIHQLENLKESSQNVEDQKGIDDAISHSKMDLESLGKEEQEQQARTSEAEEQQRSEQEKMTALSDVLDQLEQTLENVGRSSPNNPH